MDTNPPKYQLADKPIFTWLALSLWLVLAVALSVKTWIDPAKRTVLPAYEVGVQNWWSDTLYNEDQGYLYTPTFSVAYTPLAILPDRVGGLLWNLMSIGALLWTVRVLVRDVLPGRWSRWSTSCLLTLTLLGAARGLWSGQANAVLLCATVLGCAHVLKQRWWSAAGFLAAAVYIKIWPLALVMLLMARWPRELSWRFGGVAAALGLLPFLTRPPAIVIEQYQSYLSMLAERRMGERWGGYRDAHTIFEQLPWMIDERWYVGLELAAALVALGVVLWAGRRCNARSAMTTLIGAWLAWQLLWGSGTERLTYMVIAPLTSFATVYALSVGRHRLLSSAAWWLTTILGMGAVERALLPILPPAHALQPMGIVVFSAWLVCFVRDAAQDCGQLDVGNPTAGRRQIGSSSPVAVVEDRLEAA